MSYVAAALMPPTALVYDISGPLRRDAIDQNIDAATSLVALAASDVGASLVVLPEFFLTGYTPGRSAEDWTRASVTIDGREIAALRASAARCGIYLCGAFYEAIRQFPHRHFNTAFIIDPRGDVILAYRKLYAMTAKTRPADVLTRWIDEFGLESLFPVVATPLGKLGAMVARDSHWPELARSLALGGAEVIVHPCAAISEPANAGRFARRSRAFENHLAIVAANLGPMVGLGSGELPSERTPSEIVDWEGNVLAASVAGDQMVSAAIDLESLRARRAAGDNRIAQLHAGLHAAVYAANVATTWPADRWATRPICHEAENAAVEQDVIARMIAAGILTGTTP